MQSEGFVLLSKVVVLQLEGFISTVGKFSSEMGKFCSEIGRICYAIGRKFLRLEGLAQSANTGIGAPMEDYLPEALGPPFYKPFLPSNLS